MEDRLATVDKENELGQHAVQIVILGRSVRVLAYQRTCTRLNNTYISSLLTERPQVCILVRHHFHSDLRLPSFCLNFLNLFCFGAAPSPFH
jgi:hypothetical protein